MRAPVPFRLYLITDEEIAAGPKRVEAALSAVPRGAAAVQLRARSLDGRALFERALALREVTREHGALLLVNDRLDVALATGADGVHLPVAGLPVAGARRLAPHLLLGASTHTLDEARSAHRAGADFVTFGPVFATPSKAAMGEPTGLPALGAVATALPIPVLALGGVDEGRAAACVAVGAGVACIRAVLGAGDPAAAAAAMWRAITAHR